MSARQMRLPMPPAWAVQTRLRGNRKWLTQALYGCEQAAKDAAVTVYGRHGVQCRVVPA